MINEHVTLLAERTATYTKAFIATVKDEAERTQLNSFLSYFISNSAQPKLTTKSELTNLAEEIFQRDHLINFVFGLRFQALAVFSDKEVDAIAQAFANANVNRPGNEQLAKHTVLPDDAEQWTTNANFLVSLYQGNTWVLPLMALGFSMGELLDEGA